MEKGHNFVQVLVYCGLCSLLVYELHLALEKLRDGQLGTLIERNYIETPMLPSFTFCYLPLPKPLNKTFVEQYEELKDSSLLVGASMVNGTTTADILAAWKE